MKDLIDEKPLGGKSLSSIMSSNSLENPAKGLANLISKATSRKESEYYPSDEQMNNEFLRIEREKSQSLQNELNEVKSIKSEISDLRELINTAMDNNETKTTPPVLKAHKIDQFIKNKKTALYAVMATAMILGISLGQIIFGTQVETKIVEAPKKEIIKIATVTKLLPQFVTTKFVNMRNIGSSKGDILFTIPSNQKIEVLEKKVGWWKVKFHNMLESKTHKGWVYFENLKSLK